MDEEQFTAMYHQHYDPVVRYSRRLVDGEAAFDVAATVFLAAWRRRDDLPERPLSWLLETVRKTAANERRGEARQSAFLQQLQAEQPSPRLTQVEDCVVERDHVLRSWQQLSVHDRELLALIAWDGLDLREAATVLGLLPGTAAVRLHRARRRLEQAVLLTDDEAPSGPALGVSSPTQASHEEAR
jgi:RNA polymerase sigma-70 factor (ECF subfamily)